MKTKICEVHTNIKMLDNVRKPLIRLGSNKKRKSIVLVKNSSYFRLFYTHADLINRPDIREKEK